MRAIYYVWFIVNIILGVFFIIWASLAPSMPLFPGDIWLILPGIIMVLIGLLGIFEAILIEKRCLRRLSSIDSREKTIDQLSEELHISSNALRELILNLRSRGLLHVSFNPDTGELINTDLSEDHLCIVCGEPNTLSKFCSVCGTEQSPSSTESSD